jgi:hypothetical protein
MSQSTESLRAELIDAIAKVRRQLEILYAPSSIGNPPEEGSDIAALETELRGLEAALADL